MHVYAYRFFIVFLDNMVHNWFWAFKYCEDGGITLKAHIEV